MYFGARWFDPVTGRFISFDPAPVSEDNPHSFNRYAYGNNNPYKYLDPDGRESVPVRAFQQYADKSIFSPEKMAAVESAGRAMRAAEVSGDPAAMQAAMMQGAAVVGVSMGVVGKGTPAISARSSTPAMAAISMSRAVEMGVAHVGPNASVVTSGSGAFQFISTSIDKSGQTISKIARFDVNAKSAHVQKLGPHLNLETQVNGKTVTNGALKDPHIPIDKSTIRSGDVPE